MEAPAVASPETPTEVAQPPKQKKPRVSRKIAPVELPADAEGDAPLPDGATGFRERSAKHTVNPRASATVPSMTVGHVRRALNQIRRAGNALRPEHLLVSDNCFLFTPFFDSPVSPFRVNLNNIRTNQPQFNGMPAGKFALMLIQGTYNRRKEKMGESKEEGKGKDGEDEEEEEEMAV